MMSNNRTADNALLVLRTLVAVLVAYMAVKFDPCMAVVCFSSALVTSVLFDWRVAATHAAVWVGVPFVSGIVSGIREAIAAAPRE